MAGRLKNLGTALKDSKTRVLLVVVFIVVVIGLTVSWLGLKRTTQPSGIKAVAGVSGPPSIRATPGIGTPSQEYVKTVQQSDVLAAQEATREGTSTIPTLTRAAYIAGEAPQIPGIPGKAAKVGCSVEELQRARQAGVRAEEIRASSGCDAAALRAAGYTAGELLNAGFSAKELRAAGFSAKELKDAGFSAAELKEAGFTAGELAAAGFSAAELSQIGFSADELTAAGIIAKTVNKDKDCSVTTLRQARNQGVSVAQLRDRGCDADALRLAGFSTQELRDAGFSAGELRRAGYDVDGLKNAGFDANDLRNAGASVRELAAAGFQANQLEGVGFTQGDLSRAGVTSVVTVQAPTPISLGGTTISAQPSMQQPPAVTIAALPMTPADASLQALQQLQQRQAAQLSEQDRLEAIQRTQEAMQGQTSDLFSSWSPPTTQVYVEGKAVELQQTTTVTGATQLTAAQAASAAAGQGSPPFIKAGTILFAVLDTALNSDEPGPVLATIVGGNLKGAKLLGQFQRQDKKVLLTFTTLSIPSFPNSIAINTVAIDPNTARTALASNVDSHYLLRYGTLIGSAFISGLGQATMQSGSQIQNSIFSSTVTTASLSVGEKALVALGQAGQQLGNATAGYFYTPPTVRVDAGASLGILFMADASLASAAPTPPTFQAPQVQQTLPVAAVPVVATTPVTSLAPMSPPAAQHQTTQTTSVQTTAVQPSPANSPPLPPSQTAPAPFIPYR